MLQSAKFKNNDKNDPLVRGLHTTQRHNIFIWNFDSSEFYIMYLSMVKKTKWLFDWENSIFQNKNVKNFKNLEILCSKRFFQFSSDNNFWHIYAGKLKFSTYVLYWEYYEKIKNQTVRLIEKL